MTVEQLLIPRIMIIKEWPMMPPSLKKGQVFTLNNFEAGKFWHEHTESEPIHLEVTDVLKFGDNLRRLKWWEERKIEDMPDYFMVPSGDIYKVRAWPLPLWGHVYVEGKGLAVPAFRPATREEYEAAQAPA